MKNRITAFMLALCMLFSNLIIFNVGTEEVFAAGNLPDNAAGYPKEGTWEWRNDKDGWKADYNFGNKVTTITPDGPGYNIQFNINNKNATGTLKDTSVAVGADFSMPVKSYVASDSYVIGFDKDPNAANPTYKPGETYKDIGTYGEEVTLYAIWQKVNQNTAFKNGEMEFYLKDGQNVLFENLPANTHYEIYEETEAGWQLVEAVNDKGRIKSSGRIAVSFTNTYEPNVAYAVINGKKLVDNESFENGGYKFKLLDSNGKQVGATVTSDENGNFSFDPIKYTKDGDLNGIKEKKFTYTVVEGNLPSDKKSLIDKDTSSYTIDVTVTDNGKGELKALVVYPDNKPLTFNNIRKTTALKITKDIVSDNVDVKNLSQEFTIKVQLSNEKKARIIKLNKANNYLFTLNGLYPGTKYEIEEIDIPDGYSVENYENKSGTIDIDASKNSARVINRYTSTGSFRPSINKELVGRDLKANEFKFNVFDNSGKKVASSYNDANGIVNGFGAIDVLSEGEHVFTIKEENTKDDSIEYDNSEITVTINAVDDGRGHLIIETPSYKINKTPKNNILNDKLTKYNTTFVNTVKPGTLTITKEVKNIISNDLFTLKIKLLDKRGNILKGNFNLTSSDPDTADRVISNDSSFTIKSGEILSITGLPDGAKYEIEETQMPDRYSLASSSNTKGTISSNKVSEANFINTYDAKGTFQITGLKTFDGQAPCNKKFEFILLDNTNRVIDKVVSDSSGNFAFAPFKFTKEDLDNQKNLGIKRYKVIEVKGNDENIAYDLREFLVDLELYNDNGEIKVKETITTQGLRKDNIIFENKTDKEKVKFTIKKTVVGEVNSKEKFNIAVYMQKPGENMTTRLVSLSHNDVVEFNELPTNTKVFIRELDTSDSYKLTRYTVDGQEHDFILNKETGEPNDNSVITLDGKDKRTTEIEVVNQKVLRGEHKVRVFKKLNNDFPGIYKFNFTLSRLVEENGVSVRKLIATAISDKFGNIDFKFIFKDSDLDKDSNGNYLITHKEYELKEVNDNQTGVTYDKSVYKISFDISLNKETSDIVVTNYKVEKDGQEMAGKEVTVKDETTGEETRKIEPYEITFLNKKKFISMPTTGSEKMLCGLIITAIIIGATLFYIKKKEKH